MRDGEGSALRHALRVPLSVLPIDELAQNEHSIMRAAGRDGPSMTEWHDVAHPTRCNSIAQSFPATLRKNADRRDRRMQEPQAFIQV